MEGKGEQGGSQATKLLENLKKHVLEVSDSSDKGLSSHEVCASFVELSESICVAAQKPNASQLISHAVELLVRACSSSDHHIRLSASENLRKLIKSLMNTHLSRLQEDLFHELKKNGTSRSLCVALDCYASLFRLTRLSKRSVFAQNLVPVLFRLTSREEEALHEALQEAFKKILPIMAPCLPAATVQFLIKSFVDKLPSGSSTYRRMTSSTVVLVLAHCKSSSKQAEWLLNKLLDMGTKDKATSGMVHGVLLIIQQLCSKMTDIDPPCLVLKQAYSFSVSCLLHRDTNTAVSALEALHQLLLSASIDVQTWLISSVPDAKVATNYWFNELPNSISGCGTPEDQRSVEGLEIPCDTYFDPDQSVASRLAGTSTEEKDEDKSEAVLSVSTSSASTAVEVLNPKADITESACLATQDGPDNPLGNIVKYLIESVLTSSRVSSQSLALACITAAVDISPTVLPSLDSLETFTSAQDPKLRSRFVKLIATVISSNLRASRGDFNVASPVVNVAKEHLTSLLGDDTPVVLKAVCEALQLCIPVLIQSSQPAIVGDIIQKLLPLCDSSYWLTKVELLQTLGCLDFTSLATFAPSLPETVLKGVVFKLLADSDHRVRTAASECSVLLASNIQLRGDPILAHAQWQSTQLLSHLHPSFIQLSLAGIADTFVKVRPRVPLGLDHMLWFLVGNISTSVDATLQRGCLEALHALSVNYPPPSLADEWNCSGSSCSLIAILQQLLTSSKLVWSIQAHCELLELTNSVFLACALPHMHQQTPQGGGSGSGGNWCALTDPTLSNHASTLFKHIVKLLCVFVHVIEQKEPEVKEKRVQLHVPSPRKNVAGDLPSPSKPKAIVQDALHKLPFTAKDGIGQFAGSAHYMKVYDACKAAFTNYRVTLDPVGQDKFSTLLQICHNALATILEVSLADDICENVEEILSYIGCTVKIEPSGALLCVQQLLNALFGMNTAAQHTHLYSPYISSLPYDITPARSPVDSDSLYEVALTGPISLLTTWLQPFGNASSSPKTSSQEKSGGKKRFLPLKKALVMKPVNSVSSIKDFIGFFEPLVIHSLNRFPYTSSTLLQQRVLFLLVQLLNLKVRYELLDCNHLFLESVMKMVSLLESGIVRGGELLVPHLFQFLVLLAYDTSSLVTIPQVIQRCDGVMASGHNVTTFAIPALKPLVLNLFVRSSKDNPDLDTQREVVLNMLLRLVDNSGVIVLLTYVLDCYQRNKRQWEHVSTQIYAALLPRIGRLEVALDNKESLVVLYQLFSTMDPHIINIQALLGVILKQQSLKTPSQLLRWLNIICTTYQLMITIFPESTFQQGIQTLQFAVPELDCSLAHVDRYSCSESSNRITQLAEFVRGTLYLAASALSQVNIKRCSDDYELLPLLTVNILLMVQSLIQGHYHKLRGALSSLPASDSLTEAFIKLSTSYPLLTIQYANLSISLYGRDLEWVHKLLTGSTSDSAGSTLIQHAVFLLVCENWQFAGVFKKPQNDTNTCVAISKSPALLKYCQEEIVRSFLCSKNKDGTVTSNLFDQLKSCDLSSPTQCLKALQLASVIPSSKSLQFICTHLLTHPTSVISTTAARVALALIEDMKLVIGDEVISELTDKLKLGGESSTVVLKKLQLMSRKSLPQVPSVEPPEAETTPEVIEKAWYLDKLQDFLVKSNASYDVCALHLGQLDQESMTTVIHSERFPTGLLESCITHGVLLSLNKASVPSSIQQEFSPSSIQDGQLHPLLQVSVSRLLQEIITDPSNSQLTHPLVRLLASRHQLPNCVTFNDDSLKAIVSLCQNSLLTAVSKDDPLAIQSAMDCCSLALHCSEIQQAVSEEWVCQIVSHLFKTFTQDHSVTLIGSEEADSEQAQSTLSTAKVQLFSMLQVLLHPASLGEFESLHTSIESLTFALCRLPLVHNFIMTPPVLMGGGKVSEKVLDQGLMESEVLFEYMQRCNSVGWLNRPQFEERWMQLLGVINQPPPMEGTHPEEYQAHSLNVCAGLQAVTSLLLTTMLRPHLGDPTASVPMHTHRIGDMLFLGSKPGRKLAQVRKVLEYQVLLQCGVRSNLYSYYQSPLLRHLSSPHYPPIFTWNIERQLGDNSLGSGQMSLNSLWPILLSQVVPQSQHLDKTAEVDVRSCILSLVDLFTHWLSHPIHTLLLHHLLQSILMLSDLFAVPGHFEWMLQQCLELFEQHPQEDMTVMSLAIQGILKAASVLKVIGSEAEKVAKAVEKSLATTTDSVTVLQTACICGMLYVTEHTGSEVVALTISTLTKVILAHLQLSKKFTEAHTSLVWSLAVSLLMNHSNQIKDANFTSLLLDQVLPLLSQPDLSTSLFHSVCTGLELLVVNFSFYAHDRNAVATAAARWFVRSDHSKSLAALSLLLTCMYTGEEASVVSGLAAPSMDPMETALQSREHVNNLMERLRHGPLVNVVHLVHIIPQLIVDFLSPMEVLQLVVTDFVSPHQTRPQLSGAIMAEVFSLLLSNGDEAILIEWILLSMDSFAQLEPEMKAVWAITCLLTAASTTEILRSIFPLVCYQNVLSNESVTLVLQTACQSFYAQCTEKQQKQFLRVFKDSKYLLLNGISQMLIDQQTDYS